jgi:dienelactone hydrolase
VLGRRAFVVQTMALAALPAFAAKTPALPRIGKVRWPGPGHDLHGYMAVPPKAHGPQPAVLVIHDPDGADTSAAGMADSLAEAGFVACTPAALASLEDGIATVRYLATNAYATGKVAAVGIGWGGALVDRIAASPGNLLSCGVTFETSAAVAPSTLPMLRFAEPGGADDYARAWREALAFLITHLL